MTRSVAVSPATRPEMFDVLCKAVEDAGAILSSPENAEGLIWADPSKADLFPEIAKNAPHLQWIQLPYAGIEPFAQYLDDQWTWSCAKGVYAREVAETALSLSLSGFKNLHGYARATSWTGPIGQVLGDSKVCILGAGGITQCLLPLLTPFGCDITVVRRRDEPIDGANRTVPTAHLLEILPRTDLLILALSLTDETRGIINKETISALPNHAWIVNVARGGHIVTDDLSDALQKGSLGGAALDVTDPAPLPDHHPLWTEPRCLITPHIGNTPEMGLKVLGPFISENVRRFCKDEPLLGLVDVDLGY